MGPPGGRAGVAQPAEGGAAGWHRVGGGVKGGTEGTAPRSITLQQLVDREVNVPRDLPEQRRRDVAAGMERDRCPSAVRMSELPVGATLPRFSEAQTYQKSSDLTRLQNWYRAHLLRDSDRLKPHEFGLELGLTVL